MTRYVATIEHHSISRARRVDVGNSLSQAKASASAEFSGELLGAEIVIYDTRDYEFGYPLAVAARKRVGSAKWHPIS